MMDITEDFNLRQTSKTNHLLIDTFDFSKDKIFSSTALDNKTETESFSLHLSESFIDETQDSSSLKWQDKLPKAVIVINDSDNESVLSNSKPNISANDENLDSLRKMNVTERSKTNTPQKCWRNHSSREKCPTNMTCKKSIKDVDKKIIIEESDDSEIDESQVPQIIKDTVSESVTLSERKKKEIMRWLSMNFDGSQYRSSCSQESIVADSRHSGVNSSGNSSLERFEMHFETPNNRDKFSKLKRLEESNSSKTQSKQSTIDQYLERNNSELDSMKNKLPTNKHLDKTPSNESKKGNSDRTPLANKVSSVLKKTITSESYSLNLDIPTSKSGNSTPTNKILKTKNWLPDSFDLNTPSTKSSSKSSIDIVKSNSKKLTLQKPVSSGYQTNELFISDKNFTKTPSSEKTPKTNNFICPSSLISEDIDSRNSSDVILIDDKSKQLDNDHVPIIDTTINDCADILENLYGSTWRNKAVSLVSVSEPRKKTTKQIIKNSTVTKKKSNSTKLNDKYVSDNNLLGKENGQNILIQKAQTTIKKSRRQKNIHDSFINDDSTNESSPDCSYYTALSNPAPYNSNNLKIGTPSTIKMIKKNKNNMLAICDSETDDDMWKRNDNKKKLTFDSSSSSDTSEFDPEDIVFPKNIVKANKKVNFQSCESTSKPSTEKKISQKSFLASLSKDVPLEESDLKAMIYKAKYPSIKEELCKILYKLFNENVFDNKLPEDMLIEWSVRLRGTAGKCYNKQSLKALGKTVRSSRIVLASKILDSPDRLRDTLIHEMCHAATWLINGVSDGHGNFWKAWATKAVKAFPELPPISRCHNYEIQTKFTYKCKSCGYSVGRHSKSLDLNKKRCGYCHGEFELLINKVTKNGKVQKSAANAKEPSGFALYVKENYHLVKQKGVTMKHADVMKLLGQKFSAVKLTPKSDDKIQRDNINVPLN
ncbi:hypothetical protein TKK_0001919 [Trichogramma kaykai]|uniref:SprT-like domain-containing protein n=1 Tax=Trichogramma kaykai TaxID=54128 RepID=A0ABD2W5T3_9HYME